MSRIGAGKAWDGIMRFPFNGRTTKPRTQGLTMIIDKGLGLKATEDLLNLAADCIDFLKLSFGTSAFYDRRLLKTKTGLVRSYDVDIYPGGTFFEIAVLQGRLDSFLEEARDLGFTAIEISDGTVTLPLEQRTDAILKSIEAGFRVITEVGKKHPADLISQMALHELILSDMECGAFKVIIEGRESGKGVVIYDDSGEILENDLEALVRSVGDPSNLIWEAPLKKQQQDLILRFGPNVNLGNIHPEDILALEALRVGLRGDTLRASLLASKEGDGVA